MSFANPSDLQRQAAHPESCVWVAASAGTGKTKVLTDRVLNLLLAGTAPHRILCLTFTRAAAGEMQNRLSQKLSEWATLGAEDLCLQLTELLGRAPSPEQINRAQRLFPLVLDSPGGMKILTIHAFCQAILKRFPLEARLSPHFTVIDENETELLLGQIHSNLLRTEGTIRTHLYQLTDVLDDLSFQDLFFQLVNERHRLSWILNDNHGLEKARHQMEVLFDTNLDDDEGNIRHQACENTQFAYQQLLQACRQLLEGTKTDIERGQAIADWLSTPQTRSNNFNNYLLCFLTQTGEIRKKLATNALADKYPALTPTLFQEAERLLDLQEKLHNLKCAKKSWAITHLGTEIIKAYHEEKQRRGYLDYDDLIQKTANLLKEPEVAPWVLYKLDGGLDHILVDEAQDTNHHQWTVISALAEEFFAGANAHEMKRTLFIVGDAKQSIYSFQGANPYVFDRMRQQFIAKDKSWQQVSLQTSFRSTEAVLRIVDKTFEDLTAREGVAIQEDIIAHQSYRKGHGGLVEVWPLVEPNTRDELPAWSLIDPTQESEPTPPFRLAQAIAYQIRQWLDQKEILASKGRPIQPRDIMILVRRRSTFVDGLVTCLKQLNIPVAGSDRLELLGHLAIQDLLALGEFVIQPEDDLNLASLLKSPLVGCSEDTLLELAADRGNASLWEALVEKKDQFPTIYQPLERMKSYGLSHTPLDFYNQVLTSWQGRKQLTARLGLEILDPLEEFLNLLEHFQSSHSPHLLAFLTWIKQGEVHIKRDLEQAEHNEVRIMTVHGAKGLQAPIVFLPDTMQVPRCAERILWASYKAQKDLPIWSPPAHETCETSRALKQEAQQLIEQEYRRLLYVAMTRAEDRLYICGWRNQTESSQNSWYNLIARNMQSVGSQIDYDSTKFMSSGWQGEAWRYTCPQLTEIEAPLTVATVSDTLPLPRWATTLPFAEQKEAAVIQPSQFSEEDCSLSAQQANRGKIIHKLLEYLPDVPAEMRRHAAEQLLKVNPYVEDTERGQMIENVLKVFKNKSIQDWFGPNSRAEVPISGEINGQRVSGQIDRICVINGEVIIIDYKTNRKPAANIDEIPTIYLHQLATYKEILQRIYSHHTIRCVLLWTETLQIMEVPEYLLNNQITQPSLKTISKSQS